ncbi:COR domain-containing protein [Azospirillum sp. sgz302134]
MRSLQHLDCSDTEVNDLAPLASVNGLQHIDCSGTRVSDLAPLASVTGLQHIYCSGTRVNDLAPLASVTGLQHIDCSGTSVNDLAPLASVTGLQHIDCSGTSVNDLAPLASVTGLQHIDCSRTQVSDLAPLASITGLQHIDCSRTQVSDLAPLAGITGLQHIDCSGTQVSDLAPLASITGLQHIDCSGCRLRSLPADLLNHPSLTTLVLHLGAVAGIPPTGVLSTNIADNCLDRIRAHFADLGAGAAVVPGVKLLLLGNGCAGKTQIARWLAGQEFDPVWNSTHGIQIGEALLPGEREVRLRIWDFGGQDIYHGAHALFLNSPAILAVVWAEETERQETHSYGGLEFRNQPLAYWIDVARHQGHPASPVLVVQSKCDRPEHDARRPPVPDVLLDDLPYCKPLNVSAMTGRGREALKEALGDAATWLRAPERIGQPLVGIGRLKVQQRLEKMREDDMALPRDQRRHRLLSMAAFEAICAEEGGVSSPRHLLTYLDAEGTVFHRPGLFHDHIVLDQDWALEAIYAVFERDRGALTEIRRANGRFTLPLLGRLVWRDYSQDDQTLFISMMRSCGICFRHRTFEDGTDRVEEYIAPDLLPNRAAVSGGIAGRWDDDRAGETAVFRYPMLHGGLIRAIMAEVGEMAGADALYWQGGLCGSETTSGSRVMIEQTMSGPWRGEIRIRTQRGQAAEQLDRLVKLVESAQARFGLRPEAVERSSTAHSMKESQTMTFGQEKPKEPEWYVSYAWGDKTPEGRKREKIVDDLCAAAAACGHVILRDKEVLGLGDSISSFMRRIGEGDRVFVILSDKYLRSPHCMFELSEIWRTSQMKGDAFLDRVRVYALEKTKIWDPRDWADWAIHWKTEYDDLDGRARAHGAAVLGQRGNDRLRQMQFFYTQVADILGTIADIVQPRSFEELVEYGFDDGPTDGDPA